MDARAIWCLPLACFYVLLFSGCSSLSSEHGHVPDADSARIFQQFQQLQPPFDSATAFRVLGDSWTRRVKFYDLGPFAGYLPLHGWIGYGDVIAVADFRAGTHTEAGYGIYLHAYSRITDRLEKEIVKSRQGCTPFPDWWVAPFPNGWTVKFFQGGTSDDILIDQYTLCYPDGHMINVQTKSRRVIPPDTYTRL